MEVFYTCVCFVRYFLCEQEEEPEDREALETKTNSKRQRQTVLNGE